MSIISEALKKAEQVRGRTDHAQDIYKSALTRKRFKSNQWVRGLMRVGFFLSFLAVLGGSGYFVLIKSADVVGERLARGIRPQLAQVDTLTVLSHRDIPGSGRYIVEERPFHDVGVLSAQKGDPLFVLSGIAQNEDGYLAIINDQIFRKGDLVEGAQIIDITRDYVELELNDERIILERQ